MSDIRINGKGYDFDDLLLDEIEEIEEMCGGVMEDLDFRRAKVLKVIVYTLLRRDQSDLTLEAVGRMSIGELAAGMTDGDDAT